MSTLDIWLLIIAGVFFSKYAEHRLHLKNYKILKSYPHEEFKFRSKLYIYELPTVAIVIAYLEYMINNQTVPEWLPVLSLIILACGFFLKLWSLYTLNCYWTKRSIFLKGMKKPERGPYQWISHPEYLARIIEIIGICLYLGSVFTTVFFSFIMIACVLSVVSNEKNITEEYDRFSRSLDYS